MNDGRKLLIVDDNESLLLALEHNLRQAGYSVVKAYDGREALKAAIGEKPDIILSDVEMPEMDGIEFCKRLREVEGFSETPFVFFSAHGGTDEKVTGLRSGGDDYIVKPVDIEELIARLDGLCAKKSTKPQKQLSGRLSEISVVDVLQFLDLAKKEGCLHISEGARHGEISLRGGMIVASSCDGATGEDALIAMLQLDDGSFDFEPKPTEDSAAARPLNVAMMEAMQLIDERAALKEFIPKDDSPLRLMGEPSEEEEELLAAAIALQNTGSTLERLVQAAGLSRARAEVMVAKLVKAGFAEVQKSEPEEDPLLPAAGPEPKPEPAPKLEPEANSGPTQEQTSDLPDPAPRVSFRTRPIGSVFRENDSEPAERPQRISFRRPAPDKPEPAAAAREEQLQPATAAKRVEVRSESVSAKAVKILFAYTDEEEALKVLSQIAKVFGSEQPKRLTRGSVDFHRIQTPAALLHVFSLRGDRKFSFLWEPLVAKSDASLFLIKAVADIEQAEFFEKRSNAIKDLPLVTVSTEEFASKRQRNYVLGGSGDILMMLNDILESVKP